MENFQTEEMPEGMPSFGEGEMPEGMPSFGEGEMPEGMESGEFSVPQGDGGFGVVRIVCIVVGILCILVDAFCGFQLFKIRRQEKVNPLQIAGDDEARKIIEETLDPAAERMKKQKKNRKTMMALIAVLLILVLVLQTLSSGVKDSSSASVKEEVITAQVENGDISRMLKSSGVLAVADSESIAVPGDIAVTEYLVSNGDAVDEEIQTQKDAAVTSSMEASASGTVVAVYAKDEKDVVDIMYEKGALMLISLDDLLAVTIDNPGNLTVGDKVKVIDSDKKKHTGKVASIEKETVAITVPLDEFDYNEKVTVKNTDGKKLGSGKLYIYSQQKITGYSGTISDVKVSKGDTVKVGTTLLTLKNTDYTAAYQTLMNKRIVLEDQYNRLVEIAGTGYVYVKEAGTVSGIDEGLLEKSVAKTGSGVLEFLTSSEETLGESSEVILPDDEVADNEAMEDEGEAEDKNEGDEVPDEEKVTISKTANIVWLDTERNVMTEGYPENVSVELFANGTVMDTVVISDKENWIYTWTDLPVVTEEGEEISYTIAVKDKVEGYTSVSQISGSVTVIINIKDEVPVQKPDENVQENESPSEQQDKPSEQQDKLSEQQNMMGIQQNKGYPSGFGVAGATGSPATDVVNIEEEEKEDPSYIFKETTLCLLTPDDGVKVDITIDELDILGIFMGQECEITLDAFPGQSFEGKVTGIDQSGTSSEGNAKYIVTINMTKEKEMLLGMNASVTLVINKEENVLMIPEEALVEQGEKVFVYTEYDKNKDELGGMTEITTGQSDGKNVQITSGLETGQEYYYRYADSISYSFKK